MDEQNTSPPPGIPQLDWEVTPASVKALVVVFIERMRVFEEQVEFLKERLNTNSRNSSKPPSQDPPGTPPKPGRKKSKRKRGGQPGHKGHMRVLFPPEQCARIEDHRPDACKKCGGKLAGDDPNPQRHQVVEIPPVTPTVEEHRLHALACGVCGTVTRAVLPGDVEVVGYGPRLTAIVGYMAIQFGASMRKSATAMSDLFGVQMAHSTVELMRHEQSVAVGPAVDEALQYVQEQPVVHADETGFRQGNGDGGNPGKLRAWLWVAATSLVVVFRITLSRSAGDAKALLGANFAGYLVSDRYGGYGWVRMRKRQLCWSHLLRDFVKLSERTGASGRIGKRLLAEGRQLFVLWGRVKDGTLSRGVFRRRVAPIRKRVRVLLEEGAGYEPKKGDKTTRAKTARTCKNLLKLEPALWLFVRVEGVEPTNNEAERNVRWGVILRRLMQGTQSRRGSEFVARMLTVLLTLRKQNRNVLEYLTGAIQARRIDVAPPSLLPAP